MSDGSLNTFCDYLEMFLITFAKDFIYILWNSYKKKISALKIFTTFFWNVLQICHDDLMKCWRYWEKPAWKLKKNSSYKFCTFLVHTLCNISKILLRSWHILNFKKKNIMITNMWYLKGFYYKNMWRDFISKIS